MSLDTTQPCPKCSQPVGEHTIDGYAACLMESGANYHLPVEEIPGGPIVFPHIEGHIVSEASVAAAVLNTALGQVPALRFIFSTVGAGPMSRIQLPPVTYIGDPDGLARFVELVDNAAALAIERSTR